MGGEKSKEVEVEELSKKVAQAFTVLDESRCEGRCNNNWNNRNGMERGEGCTDKHTPRLW